MFSKSSSVFPLFSQKIFTLYPTISHCTWENTCFAGDEALPQGRAMPKLQQCVRIVQLTLYTRLSKIKSVDCAQFIMESVFGSRPKAADHRSPENKNYRREDRMQSSVLSLACELLWQSQLSKSVNGRSFWSRSSLCSFSAGFWARSPWLHRSAPMPWAYLSALFCLQYSLPSPP